MSTMVSSEQAVFQVVGGEFLENLQDLPELVRAMGELGVRAAMNFEVDNKTKLVVLPKNPIVKRWDEWGVTGGVEAWATEGKLTKTSEPFEVRRFSVVDRDKLPGRHNNVTAAGPVYPLSEGWQQGHYRYFFNLKSHEFEITKEVYKPKTHDDGYRERHR